jgi:hypothetical protein
MLVVLPISAAEWALFDLRTDKSSSKLGIICRGCWLSLDNTSSRRSEGVTSMNRTRTLLCLPALLAVALTVSPVRADPELTKTDAQKILDLLKEIQGDQVRLRQDLGRMQQDNESRQRLSDDRDTVFEKRLRSLEDRLAELDRASKSRVSNYPPEPATPTAEQLRDLQAQIDQLKRNSRIASEFTPSETVIPPPVLGTGVVRIQNLSFNTSQVRVNGVTYTVLPGETSIRVPAGTFTYEVLADGRGFPHAPQLRELPATTRFTVTLTP